MQLSTVGALAIFSIALFVRLLHVSELSHSPYFSVLMGDARAYHDWARNLAAGDWIGRDVFYQAPLYPYFLGVFYATGADSPMAIRIVQAVVGSLSCVLLGMTAARLWSPGAGWIAGVGLALYAPAVFFDALIQKSVLDVFLITLMLWFVSRIMTGPASRLDWFLLGGSVAALSLTRENGLLLGIPVLVWALQKVPDTQAPIQKLRRVVAVIAGLIVVFAPVVARNFAVDGGLYVTTSQFGSNFYIGNNPKADGSYVALREGRGSPEYERRDATEIAERELGRTLRPGDVSAYWRDRAFTYIASQPGDWLSLMGRKMLLLVSATEMIDTEAQQSHAEWSPPLLALGLIFNFATLLPLAVLGAFIVRGDARLWILHALTVTYAISVLAFFVVARYRYPMVPFLMLYAAGGLAALPGFVRRASARKLVPLAALMLVVIAVAQWPVMSVAKMRAITETNLGAALQEQGRLPEAIAAYERAIALQPDHAPGYNNLGVALRAQGRLPDAISAYRKAIAVRPDYSDAHFNLANALLEAGRAAEAAEHFGKSDQVEADSAGTHNNLGIALARQGRLDDALREFQTALTLDPRSAMALRNIGDVLAMQGKHDDAVDYFGKAIALRPDDAALRYDLGSVYLDAQRATDAERAFSESLRLTDSAEARNNLGIALAMQGRLAEASLEFQRALSLKPDYPEARKNLEMSRGPKAPRSKNR